MPDPAAERARAARAAAAARRVVTRAAEARRVPRVLRRRRREPPVRRAGSAGAGGAAGAAGAAGARGRGRRRRRGGRGRGGCSGRRGRGGRSGRGGARRAPRARPGRGGRAAGGGAAGAGGATLPANVILESMTSSTTATSFSARLTNTGPTTPLISAIKIRYYFVDDSGDHTATPAITSASWKIASPPTTINLASTGGGCATLTTFASAPTRNSYVDFGCALDVAAGVGDTITIAMTIDPAAQVPTNDYSYLPPVSVSQFVANDHMLAMVSGVVVAGTPPP